MPEKNSCLVLGSYKSKLKRLEQVFKTIGSMKFILVFVFLVSKTLILVHHDAKNASMLEYSMMDCMFSRYIYPANGS